MFANREEPRTFTTTIKKKRLKNIRVNENICTALGLRTKLVFSFFFLYHLFEIHINLSLGYLSSEVTQAFISERSKPLVSFLFLGSV